VFESSRTGDVLTFARPETAVLSTGWHGGRRRADAIHSVTVPEGWHPEDVAADVRERLAAAGIDWPGEAASPATADPVLLTGVAARHCRGARRGPVEAYATVGLSNPAALPADPDGPPDPDGESLPATDPAVGTVNVVVGTTRALADGALANLVAVAAAAKATTLSAAVGVPGTTSDAVVVACDPAGEPARYSGAATPVGAAARTCVREAVGAALAARYEGEEPPTSVAAAEHGVVADGRAETFRPGWNQP